MLAVMAQPQLHTTPLTLSVPILPSAPMRYSQPPPSKRPKLSLNTTNTPTVYGKKSTSLSWETLSATSPTDLNTFSNGYHQHNSNSPTSRRPRPRLQPLTTTTITKKLSLDQRISTPISPRPDSRDSDSTDSTTSTTSSVSSASTLDSLSGVIPYKVTYAVSSILSNGPYPRSQITKSQPRRMFPTTKRVAFRAPLTEEVQTTKYTLAHSDIQSSVSTISTIGLDNVEEQVSQAQDGPAQDSREANDSCPETPIAGRRKKDQQWRWTLGPLQAGTGTVTLDKDDRHDVEDDDAENECNERKQ